MRTHQQVSLNQLQSLLNNLKTTTSKLSKTKGRKSISKIPLMLGKVKRGPGRPRKSSMNFSRKKLKVGCSKCGCSRNRKSKMVMIQRRPKGNKMVSRALVSNHNGNYHQLSRPSMAQTKRNVRSIINKLISRKNHTRRTNLATMIERINGKAQLTSQSQPQLQPQSQSQSQPHLKSMTKCKGRQSKKPVVKSHTKTVKSYYTSSNNGTNKVERGRRIEDDSTNPFIRVNALNNGQMKSFQVSRH
jgi:hypothetical protein